MPGHTLRKLLIASTALVPLAASPAHANPLGPQVVGGNATVTGVGTPNVTVQQGSERAIINWQQFDLGRGDTTRFVQPGASSVILNRVTGGMGPSTIDGSITANGRVFIVNRDGILFGNNARIDTRGFLATTHDITNENFMAGKYQFDISGRPDASIVNNGVITAHGAGFAALVAPGVRNAGVISARLGTVGLTAANGFTLDFYGDRLITLNVSDAIAAKVRDVETGQPLDALVKNTGKLKANGGRVQLTAVAARQVVDSVINNTGVIEARTIGRRGGSIVLGAATASGKGAGAPPQVVKVSGTLSVAANKKGKGGKIEVTGEEIVVTKALIDASGVEGGGTVLIGGDWGGGNPNTSLVSHANARLEGGAVTTATRVSIDGSSTIDVSATGAGNAGKAIVWADDTTSFAGTILGRGGPGGGNGAFAEVSGKLHLNFAGAVDLSASAGRNGTLLLDPADYYIDGTPPSGADFMSAATLMSLLATQDVVIATNNTASFPGQFGDIYVYSPITWSSGTTLTLSAYRNIVVTYSSPSPMISNTGAGSLVMHADSTGTGVGTVMLNAGTNADRIDWSGSTGTVKIFYNPTGGYATPTNFLAGNGRVITNLAVPNQLTAYMLVNSATDLQNLNLNANGTYALGRDINATGFTAPAPWTFGGLFDGLGHTISNLNLTSASNPIGLFPTIGASGIVQNLNLTNVAVTAGADTQAIGGLAGVNQGTIFNVTVSGNVNGQLFNHINAGGLVGQNDGTITSSTSSATVTVASSSGDVSSAGGLVGYNIGTLSHVSASGPVSGSDFSHVGGLVGDNQGTVADSQATGSVSINGVNFSSSEAGGLVGYNEGTIERSSATGTVLGNYTNSVAVLMLGGLVGWNDGPISASFATGTVSGNALAISAGGLVGYNYAHGSITDSHANGPVSGSAGGSGVGGGLVGTNLGTITTSYATGPATGNGSSLLGGLAGWNTGDISYSSASGPVTGGLVGGGLVGINLGNITWSLATGNVSSDATMPYGFVGGLVGINTLGTIANSAAFGTVTTGDNGVAGGLVATNAGLITQSFAVGAVAVGNYGIAGGLVGLNLGYTGYTGGADAGVITQAYALGPVTGGANSFVGGLVGQNTGAIDQTYAAGPVTGGAGSTAGGLIASNTFNVPAGFDPTGGYGTFSNTPGTATNSYWDTQTTQQTASAGGTGLTTSQLRAMLPAGFNNANWTIIAGSTYPYLSAQPADNIPYAPGTDTPTPDTPTTPDQSRQTVQDFNLLQLWAQVAWKDPDSAPAVGATVVTNTVATQQPRQPGNPPPGQPPRESGVPPPGETRFIKDQVVFQVNDDIPAARVQAIARALGLTLMSQQSIGLIGRTVFQFRITNGRSVADVIRRLEAMRIIAAAQPNYTFELAQGLSSQAPADAVGDPDQYMVTKLRLAEAHRLSRGDNVLVAVIDSEIDQEHPDLSGVIIERFSTNGGPEKPHAHGTAMAGAIGAHKRLLGVAPGARLLAIQAFGTASSGAQGTSFQILKGLDWAATKGARVVNMSFAGPRDPGLQRAMKAARDKGIVLIAAAGNAGPKSPPLYPGADPNVLAVTAIDTNDALFDGANRGRYVSVAAPGVDVLVPAPEGGYAISTGTSVAAAHASGVAALVIARKPSLTPDEVVDILMTTARDLGPRGRDNEFGAGLIDAFEAVKAVDPKNTSSLPAPQRF